MKQIMKKFTTIILIIVILLAISSPIASARTGFVDIWHHPPGTQEAINWGQAMGLITGHNGRFFPDDPLTRGALVLIFWRYDGKPDPGTSPGFSDVPQGIVYFDGITWAQNNGLVTGHNNRFFPYDIITREAMALILYRYHLWKNPNAARPSLSALDNFHDKGSVSPVAFEGMCWAVQNGMITGSGGWLYPQHSLTRSMAVLLLFRYQNAFIGPT